MTTQGHGWGGFFNFKGLIGCLGAAWRPQRRLAWSKPYGNAEDEASAMRAEARAQSGNGHGRGYFRPGE